jgi:hypothetical protein
VPLFASRNSGSAKNLLMLSRSSGKNMLVKQSSLHMPKVDLESFDDVLGDLIL